MALMLEGTLEGRNRTRQWMALKMQAMLEMPSLEEAQPVIYSRSQEDLSPGRVGYNHQ